MPPAAQKKKPSEEQAETPEKRALRVERIKDLIQLASSDAGDGVAAAKRACALIRKFGLDIVDPTLVDNLYKEVHHLKVELEAAKAGASQPSSGAAPNFGGGFGGAVPSGFGSTASYVTSYYHHHTQPAPPPAQQPMTAPVKVTLKFRGKCKQCGKSYDIGEEALWVSQTGIWCPTRSCYSDWLHKQNVAAGFNPGFTI